MIRVHKPDRRGRCRVCRKWKKDQTRYCPGRPLRQHEREAVERWYPWCWKVAGRPGKRLEDWEDDAQDAAVQACESARTFQPGKGATLDTHISVGASFACRSAYQQRRANGFGGLRNKRQKQPDPPPVVSFDAKMQNGQPIGEILLVSEDAENRSEITVAIERALSLLKPRLRFIIEATMFDGRRLCDLAGELGVTKERVRQLRNAGLDAMKPNLLRVAAAHGFGRGVA
jgi:RNA polymerase sigma factor (sigma-70 family)